MYIHCFEIYKNKFRNVYFDMENNMCVFHKFFYCVRASEGILRGGERSSLLKNLIKKENEEAVKSVLLEMFVVLSNIILRVAHTDGRRAKFTSNK